MDWKDASAAMQKGDKVQHRFFSPNEWMAAEGDKYKFEDGVICDAMEFWAWRTEPAWLTDWTVYKER